MSGEEHKLSGDERDIEGSAEQETAFQDESETVKFLPDDNQGAQEQKKKGKKSADFQGLSRDELECFENDPKWVKIRLVLFIIFVIGWVSMLVIAIIIVVVTPKCPPSPDLKWYQDGVAYSVNVEKFQDSNGDAVGDFAGLESRVDHLKELSVASVWIENIANDTHPQNPKTVLGSTDEFKSMAKTLKKNGVRVVIDFDMRATGLDADKPETYDALVRNWVDAGVEGFLLSLPDDISNADFYKLFARIQNLLDTEYNKQDDRDRVVIAPNAMNATGPDVRAIMYDLNPTGCAADSEACKQALTENLVQISENEAPWKILQNIGGGEHALAYKLTYPGTPHVRYGDELGLDDQSFMVWDDSETRGFTDKQGWTIPSSQTDVDSLLAQKSLGYGQVSQFSLFKNLAEVRSEQPSLMWGKLLMHDFQDGIGAFIRHAEGFAPVIVAVNSNDAASAGSLVYTKVSTNKKGKEIIDVYSQAEILVASGVDLTVGDTVDGSAIYLPAGGVLVAKLHNPDAKKGLL